MTSFLDRLAEHRRTLTDEFIPMYEATKFVRYMEREHPEELLEWLRTHAVQFASKALGDMLRRERQQFIRRASARSFAAAVAAGTIDDMHPFQMVYAIDPQNTRRALGEMTGSDHLFVANRYEDQGLRVLFLAEFHRAVANRLGTRKTSDVLTESEYLAMLNSIPGFPGPLPVSVTPPISL